MTYGDLIEHCENMRGDCITCKCMAECKSFRHGLEGLQPCYISRLWNEEIARFDADAFRKTEARR